MTIEDKREYLDKIKKECFSLSNIYKKRYSKLKWRDDVIDIITSSLNAGVIALTISGINFTPLLFISIALSGTSYIITQAQRTYNLKRRYITHDMTYKQYIDIVRKIEAILQKNHMTTNEYDQFIDQIHDRLALIDDSRII
jgi:hypothetical protein